MDIASLPSRLTAAMHNRTGDPAGSVMPPTVTGSVVTRGATGADGSSRTISSMKTLICLGLSRSMARSCGLRASSSSEKPTAAVTVSSPASIRRWLKPKTSISLNGSSPICTCDKTSGPGFRRRSATMAVRYSSSSRAAATSASVG
ncbi:Uncharacterised protein [Mycobacterium tuberculosis]|uniref:Uncharacterized protein n=1 Tax=Mycobacterium tuberculosis TaxID=1773 RepID=A0A654U6F1_MYCTX|nr:Uncharacterised protein [Mycobacterium tuberculosis]